MAAYATVRSEIARYGAGLERLPELVVVSKCDLVTDQEAEAVVADLRERLGPVPRDVVAVSAATGAGLAGLVSALAEAVPETLVESGRRAGEGGFAAEHITYRPTDQGFEVAKEGDGVFRVRGRGIEMLFERHDAANLEALAYLEQRLREIGVIAELERAGFEPGDEVRVGDQEFELHP